MTPASMSRTLRTIPLTCMRDGRCHLVSDEQMAAGRHARDGRYQALCGHTVTPTPMVDPNGRPCPNCAAQAAPPSGSRRARRPGGHRRHRPGLIRLLLARIRPHDPDRLALASPGATPGQNGRAPTAAGPESTPTSSGPAASHACQTVP